VKKSSEQQSARVLYITYDGLTDPLGQSQVLPYLVGLSERGHRITILSCEKRAAMDKEGAKIGKLCAEAGIAWHAIRYHKRPPLLSSIYDLANLSRAAAALHRSNGFDLVHSRSYLPALVGLRMKRRLGVPFIFDMRGFWADERLDGRIWDLSNPLFALVYRYFKRREVELLAEADQIISLTEDGKRILLERPDRRGDGPPIAVIPCCVDFDAFPPVSFEARNAARKMLGIAAEATVVAYLGSWGTWYLTGEMLDFFKVQLERLPEAIFLVVSREPPEQIRAAATASGIPPDRLIVRPAARDEVPRFLAAADYGLFFIMPVFSKKASSPTKMGEFLALELPVVTNGDVGDVERIVDESGAGVVVGGFTDAAYSAALDRLSVMKFDMERWRSTARRWFDLGTGVERYDSIYRRLLAPVGNPNARR